jgi:hypothetical protein
MPFECYTHICIIRDEELRNWKAESVLKISNYVWFTVPFNFIFAVSIGKLPYKYDIPFDFCAITGVNIA